MMTMRLTPEAGAATLRFSVKEQSPKMSAEAVAAMQRATVRRASVVSVRMAMDTTVSGHGVTRSSRRGGGESFSVSPRAPRETVLFNLKHFAHSNHYRGRDFGTSATP